MRFSETGASEPRPLADVEIDLVAGGAAKVRAAQARFEDLVRDKDVTSDEYWTIHTMR